MKKLFKLGGNVATGEAVLLGMNWEQKKESLKNSLGMRDNAQNKAILENLKTVAAWKRSDEYKALKTDGKKAQYLRDCVKGLARIEDRQACGIILDRGLVTGCLVDKMNVTQLWAKPFKDGDKTKYMWQLVAFSYDFNGDKTQQNTVFATITDGNFLRDTRLLDEDVRAAYGDKLEKISMILDSLSDTTKDGVALYGSYKKYIEARKEEFKNKALSKIIYNENIRQQIIDSISLDEIDFTEANGQIEEVEAE